MLYTGFSLHFDLVLHKAGVHKSLAPGSRDE